MRLIQSQKTVMSESSIFKLQLYYNFDERRKPTNYKRTIQSLQSLKTPKSRSIFKLQSHYHFNLDEYRKPTNYNKTI